MKNENPFKDMPLEQRLCPKTIVTGKEVPSKEVNTQTVHTKLKDFAKNEEDELTRKET